MIPYTYENISYNSNTDIIFRIDDRCREYVTPHWHNSLEILYILEGSQEVSTERRPGQILRADEFLVINSREIHSTRSREHCRCMVLQILYPFLKKYVPDIDRIRFCLPDNGEPRPVACENIRKNLRKIADLWPLSSSADNLRFHGLIFQILCELVRSFRTDISPAEKESSAKYISRLGHITSYVREHYAEDITLDQIAGEVSLNPDYFTRFFKKYMGMTFLDYVNSVRLEHIARDLLDTDLSIQNLLEKHGFTNYKLFMKMYKSRFNCTPGEMRRNSQVASARFQDPFGHSRKADPPDRKTSRFPSDDVHRE